jgi:hypothetical protein
MSSAADRKRKTREMRKAGYLGSPRIRIHRDALDRLVASGDLAEDEAWKAEAGELGPVVQAIEALINGGDIEKLRAEDAPQVDAAPPALPVKSHCPPKVQRKAEKLVFTY